MCSEKTCSSDGDVDASGRRDVERSVETDRLAGIGGDEPTMQLFGGGTG